MLSNNSSLNLLILLFISFAYTHIATAQSKKSYLENLVEKSEVIVVGNVMEIRSEWDKDKSRILTRVSVEVSENIKGGTKGETIEITNLGGEIDGVGELYSHMPKFTKNEEVLVFGKMDNNKLKVTDAQNGKYTVHTDKNSGERMVGKIYIKNFIQKIKQTLKAQE